MANVSCRVDRMRLRKVFANVPLRFELPDGLTFFEELGWNMVDVEPLLPAARRFRRAPWFLVPYSFLRPHPYGPARLPWSAVLRMTADH
jgi:hypothetical protein